MLSLSATAGEAGLEAAAASSVDGSRRIDVAETDLTELSDGFLPVVPGLRVWKDRVGFGSAVPSARRYLVDVSQD